MRFIGKSTLAFLLTFLIVIIFNNYTFASQLSDNSQIDSVKSSIAQNFEQKKIVLEADKSNFGLSDSESFLKAILGNGVPFYSISTDSIINNKISTDPFTFRGYIFPIKVGNKPAGIALVAETNAKWEIVDVTNNLTFEKDFADAETLIQDKSTAKFIYDPRYNLYALADQKTSGYDLVPIKDSGMLDLKKLEVKSFNGTADKIMEIYKQNADNNSMIVNTGGMGSEAASSHNRRSLYIMLALVFISIFTAFIIISRKRKHVL